MSVSTSVDINAAAFALPMYMACRFSSVRKGARFFGPQFEDWDGPMPEEVRELVDSWRKMRKADHMLRRKLRENYSEALASEAKKLMDEYAEKFSQLSKA